jgi:hypothetical protein
MRRLRPVPIACKAGVGEAVRHDAAGNVMRDLIAVCKPRHEQAYACNGVDGCG